MQKYVNFQKKSVINFLLSLLADYGINLEIFRYCKVEVINNYLRVEFPDDYSYADFSAYKSSVLF